MLNHSESVCLWRKVFTHSQNGIWHNWFISIHGIKENNIYNYKFNRILTHTMDFISYTSN